MQGRFKDNEINGKGTIQWKDDTWYEGDFVSNVRHGKGLYVDSRKQRAYVGGWYCGTKNGDGVIYYSENFKNSYDGQWIKVLTLFRFFGFWIPTNDSDVYEFEKLYQHTTFFF